jgi:hypothetical protein
MLSEGVWFLKSGEAGRRVLLALEAKLEEMIQIKSFKLPRTTKILIR